MHETFDLNTTCPYCGRVNNAASGQSGTRPDPGDVSMCWRCGQFTIFADDLTLRVPTVEEWQELVADEEVWAVVIAWMEMNTPIKAAEQVWGKE